MKVTVRLFAAYRAVAGTGSLNLDVPEKTRAGDVLRQVLARYPQMAGLSRSLVLAVNAEYASEETVLGPDDEVALIPPVSGGAEAPQGASAPRSAGGETFRVVTGAIDVAAVAAMAGAPENGALVIFLGVVRNHSEGRRVVALEYDAYPEMAEKKLAEIGREVCQRWPQCRIAVWHRIGRLAVGEVSLALVVGAPHRREAYEASRYALDRLKEVVPIWKQEIFDEGAAWVEGQEVRAGPEG